MAATELKRRGPWATAYLVLCNTIVLFLALELLARLANGVYRLTVGTPEAIASRSYGEEIHPFLQNANSPGPGIDAGPFYAGWRVEPPEPAAGDDGRVRLMFLGGSTLAYDVPRLVGEELERRGVPARTYNFAASWHTSLHSLYKFWTYADRVRPDLVVVLDGANDFYRAFTPPRFALPQYREDYSHYAGGLHPFWEPRASAADGRPVFRARALLEESASFGGALSGIARSSALVVAARRLAARLGGGEGVVAERMASDVYLRALPAFERNLGNLRLGCRAKEVRLVLLTMPYTLESGGRFLLEPGRFFTSDGRATLAPEDFAAGMARYNDAVRALADPPHARVLDLAAAVNDPALFVDEIHLTEAGKRLEAEAIAGLAIAAGLGGR